MPKRNSSTFRYPGSKTTIAPWVVERFPEHECYVEPFVGAASVFLEKPRSNVEVLNDADGVIVDTFRAIRDRGDELREWLRSTPYSRELFDRWTTAWKHGSYPDGLIERAGQHIALRYMAYGGKFDSPSFAREKKVRHPVRAKPRQFQRAGENIPYLQDRLKEAIIECGDYSDAIAGYDSDETFIYCDPPYYGVDYYEEGEGFEHERLLSVLQESSGFWCVSYAEVPPSWDLSEYHIVSRKREWRLDSGNSPGEEKLIMNYDPQNTPLHADSEQQTLPGANDD